jgi:hypothetical protein
VAGHEADDDDGQGTKSPQIYSVPPCFALVFRLSLCVLNRQSMLSQALLRSSQDGWFVYRVISKGNTTRNAYPLPITIASTGGASKKNKQEEQAAEAAEACLPEKPFG